MVGTATGHEVAGSIANRRVGAVVDLHERGHVAGARIVGAAIGGGGAARANNRAGSGERPANRRTERQQDGRGGGADVVGVGSEMQDVHRRVAHFTRLAFLERERAQHAESVVEEFRAEEHRHARIPVIGDFVVDAAASDREQRLLVVVESARRLEVDRGAQ